ncbi:MAG: thioredoxin domain-containing protein, partial [Patescibacteria group bacterium]
MVKRFKIKNLKIKKFLNLKNLERYQFLLVPLAILGGGMSVALAIVLTGGLGGGDQVPSGADIGQPTGEVEVSVDDDPVIGDPNAPVTIVEFVDFECPFCKSFFEETFPKIKSDYIDTGKVRFVLRDLPLPFHNPAATKEALAANCARDQGGDGKYFLYHDEIFAR